MLNVWGFSTGSTYKSKYGSAGLKQEYTAGSTVVNQQPRKDDYVSSKKRKQTNYGWIPNALLLVGTAIGVYKGKGLIQKILPMLGRFGKGIGKVAHKIFPNICDAITALGKAVTSPFRLIGKIGKSIGRIFKK